MTLRFGTFIDGLRRAGLLETTVVAVYGDHTGLWEWPNELERLPGFDSATALQRRVTLARVPFLIRFPDGRAAGTSMNSAGGHVDISPTLLSVLGMSDLPSPMLGRDLTGPEDAFVVFRDGSFLDDSHHFVHRFGKGSECYETVTGRSVSCEPLDGKLRRAVDRLRLSDAIVRQDLALSLAGSAGR